MAPPNKKKSTKKKMKANKWATKESGKTDEECLNDCTKLAMGNYQSTNEMKAEFEAVTSTLGVLIGKKAAYESMKSVLSKNDIKAIFGDVEGIDEEIKEAEKKMGELAASLAMLESLEAAMLSLKNDKDDGSSGEGGSNGGENGSGLTA